MRISTELWLTLFVFALSSLAAFLTHSLSTGGLSTELGPAFFPWMMVIGMFAFSVLLLVRSIWNKQIVKGETPSINWKLLGKLALFLVYMGLYATFYVQVGYLVSTGIFFVLAMLTLGERRPLHFLVIPLLITGGVYLVFTQILNVYIP
jgi:putative tricarboxylic transport membrane protein